MLAGSRRLSTASTFQQPASSRLGSPRRHFCRALQRALGLCRRPFICLLRRAALSTVSAAACFTELPTIRVASEDAPLPIGSSPQAAFERARQRTGSVPQVAFRLSASPSPALGSTFCRKLLLRSTLSTGSFCSWPFQRVVQDDASGVSCRGFRPKSRLLAGYRHKAGSQKIGRLMIVQRA
jgi:hypothetical protein